MQAFFLRECCTEPISSIDCSESSTEDIHKLLISLTSWDKTFRIFDTNLYNNSSYSKDEVTRTPAHHNYTVNPSSTEYIQCKPTGKCLAQYCSENVYLDCRFYNSSKLFAGSLGNTLECISIDQATINCNIIDKHQAPIRCISILKNKSIIVSGSWDGSIHFNDIRQQDSIESICKHQVAGKVFCMDHSHDEEWILIGDSFKNLNILNIKKLSSNLANKSAILTIPNYMKYQMRQVKASKYNEYFATSSIEGRVQINTLNNVISQEPNSEYSYTFKCHRFKDMNTMNEIIYPINSLCYHTKYTDILATGGSDGNVFIWDTIAKKRLWKSPTIDIIENESSIINNYRESIAHMSFDTIGEFLIVAASDTFDQGTKVQDIKDLTPTKSQVLFYSVNNVKPFKQTNI
ncbi:uncharacterized protein CMU_009640 [Cryptosporidium muris RN66]|uniref:Uncharacterized protein n=1 Tax=Cryptosporidium muris (strain RN66) TaxID=441375 RepID=B6AE31_CRYMR|nr:uncharacterized protein CMU_009640 [Cryptosporidium muris RN66]EEA06472.1 hypothetical protein, conserved [Cryptosporidium muris RN66]|eukprot:XP_002140821.1 hypothetical protein [Cryptosporidium muris RN66]